MSTTAALSPTHTFLSQLLEAQSLALEKLVSLLKSSKLEREIRLAALAILRFKPLKLGGTPSLPALVAAPLPGNLTLADLALSDPTRRGGFSPCSSPPSPPASPRLALSAAASEPLSLDELAQLHLLLPQVKPERFLKKHTPAHWRRVLADHFPAATLAPTS